MASTLIGEMHLPPGTALRAANSAAAAERTRPPERESHKALNDARFDVAKARSKLRSDAESPDAEFELICECADADCYSRIRITLAHYKAIRAEPKLSVRSPGHFDHEQEQLMSATARFSVVEISKH